MEDFFIAPIEDMIVAVFEISETSGMMKLVEIQVLGVKTPRGFGIDPTGQYLIAGGRIVMTSEFLKLIQMTGPLSLLDHPYQFRVRYVSNFYILR